MPWTIPNILTVIRVALIPIVVAIYLVGGSGYLTAGLFLLAGITDWADGYLARKRNELSAFGAFLDPVADKLMVCAVLVLLVADREITEPLLSPALFTITVAIIIGREITISALREWMAELGARGVVNVAMVGKIKTVFQMTAIGFLLYEADLWFLPVYNIGLVLLYVAAGLTLYSMYVYLKAAWPLMKEEVTEDELDEVGE